MKLKPINENEASEKVKVAFSEIKKTLNTTQIPLIFKLLANFEEYFVFLWERIDANLKSDFLNETTLTLKSKIEKSVIESFSPTSEIVNYKNTINLEEKEKLLKFCSDIFSQNIKLLIILIGIRENLKGVFIGETKLENDSYSFLNSDPKNHFKNKNEENYDISSLNNSLSIINANYLLLSTLNDFFAQFQNEFENYTYSSEFLEKRLEVELYLIEKVNEFPYPLGASYQRIIQMIGNKENFSEMLYLLTDFFPSNQPRLTFLPECMIYLLDFKITSEIVTR